MWGSGNATREFLYIDDMAEAVVKATLVYDSPEPVNIGSGIETSIASLSRMIAEIIEFDGEIMFDPSKPDGQPRRQLDISRAKEILDFEAKTQLKQGLTKTIKWYIKHYGSK